MKYDYSLKINRYEIYFVGGTKITIDTPQEYDDFMPCFGGNTWLRFDNLKYAIRLENVTHVRQVEKANSLEENSGISMGMLKELQGKPY